AGRPGRIRRRERAGAGEGPRYADRALHAARPGRGAGADSAASAGDRAGRAWADEQARAEVAPQRGMAMGMRHHVRKAVEEALQAGSSFGRAAAKTGTRVMVEYVSANPTGPIHIGHARGTFVGDAIARLLDAAGHDVTKEFYINDFGKQVETLGRTLYKRYQ